MRLSNRNDDDIFHSQECNKQHYQLPRLRFSSFKRWLHNMTLICVERAIQTWISMFPFKWFVYRPTSHRTGTSWPGWVRLFFSSAVSHFTADGARGLCFGATARLSELHSSLLFSFQSQIRSAYITSLATEHHWPRKPIRTTIGLWTALWSPLAEVCLGKATMSYLAASKRHRHLLKIDEFHIELCITRLHMEVLPLISYQSYHATTF